MYLNTLELQGFYGHGYRNVCIACGKVISDREDFAMMKMNNPLPSGLKQELFGVSNHEVVANVFICEPCAKRSRTELVEINEEELRTRSNGPDWWTIPDRIL